MSTQTLLNDSIKIFEDQKAIIKKVQFSQLPCPATFNNFKTWDLASDYKQVAKDLFSATQRLKSALANFMELFHEEREYRETYFDSEDIDESSEDSE